jgi:exopolysaccharide biosynthesis polyprenyl glycosylphosphotransferase
MSLKNLKRLYVVADLLSAQIVWILFFIFRKVVIERSVYQYRVPIELNSSFYWGLLIIPLSWVLLYYLMGFYQNINHKTRIGDFGRTFQTSFIGATVLFFVVILDDIVGSYRNYYYSFAVLFGLQFFFTLLFRLILISLKHRSIYKGTLRFNTLIIGGGAQVAELADEIKSMPKVKGIQLAGYISLDVDSPQMQQRLPMLGKVDNILEIIEKHNITDVVLAEPNPNERLFIPLLNHLHYIKISVMASPSMYEYMSSRSHITAMVGTPLIAIDLNPMPFWQTKLKDMMDYSVAFIALTLVSPICLFLAIGVRLSSQGPIIYTHKRIGKNGIPFSIYKFRSMYTDAEKHGPALASTNDDRTTPFGKFMRRTKLDELPNFYNVLNGDMSLVGPRPERQFFIDQIVERMPNYLLVQKIKPGITSLGQVKYGYAESIDQMLKRLKFDLVYMNNMSLWLDIRILFNTFLLVLKGRGV